MGKFLTGVWAFSALFLSVTSLKANEDLDTIQWFYPDYPPVFIASGPYEATGILDVFRDGVIARVTDYKHEKVVANMKRILYALEEGQKVCAPSLFKKPEREEYIVFSDPYLLVFPVGIVILKENEEAFKPYVNKEGAVSLGALLDKTPNILGYAISRSYHQNVDRLIKEKGNGQNSFAVTNKSVSADLLTMLMNKRFEYIVAFSYELEWFNKQSQSEDKFTFLPLEEATNYQPNYMGCPKNEWGLKAIARINQELKIMRTDPRYYGVYFNWISDIEKQRYLELLKTEFQAETDLKS